MNGLTVSQDSHAGMTMLSNRFIDEYMKDANDAQVKVYLYLLRCVGTDLPSDISAIADRFNFTEKDIMRALQYWDRLQVISLSYDDNGSLTGIRLNNLGYHSAVPVSVPVPAVLISQIPPSCEVPPVLSASPVPAASTGAQAVSSVIAVPTGAQAVSSVVAVPTGSQAVSSAITAPVSPAAAFDKNSISQDQLKQFKNREETPQLLFIVEQYLGKPLSSSDIRSICFMTDVLHFSTDLIDYLVQYCVERGKKTFHYMDKVALNWAEAGISTPKQAAAYAVKYDRNIYTVMNALGRTTSPTRQEASFIRKWFDEYGFTLEMILEACGRSVLATEKHRFEYTDGILQSWKAGGIHSPADVQNADKVFRKKKNSAAVQQTVSANPFQQFRQNQYDYDDLLQKIKIN